MKKSLIFSLLIIILASLFASKAPDGLDKVSTILNFAPKAIEHASLFNNYSMSLIPFDKISTALAGIIGVLIIFGVFKLAGLLIKKACF